jgi:hypothetical protein
MFEQELYNQPIDVHTEPGDLFYNYEIKNWNFSPRLYKILAGSAIFNIVALLAIGSSGMLTKRGCDSPFVGRVCQVLDTVYVGSLIFGTESEYADVDYTKTELENADVTFIDVTGVTPPLTYPAGYFELANPEQQASNMTDPMAGFGDKHARTGNPEIECRESAGRGLLTTPQIMPNANPNPIEGELPTDPSADLRKIQRSSERASAAIVRSAERLQTRIQIRITRRSEIRTLRTRQSVRM